MRSSPETTSGAGDPPATESPSSHPAWVDIENPPQVQYLVPLVEGLRRRGHEVRVTARDYGDTFDLLDRRGIDFIPVGRHFGAAKLAKVTGSLRRARTLRRLAPARGGSGFLVSASRSAALAARTLGIPSFALCDYEYVDLRVFRVSGSYLVHPGVIATEALTRQGVRKELLVPYDGIKEDITFAGLDIDSIAPHRFPEIDDPGAVKVLLRPPAEESHYHRAASSDTVRRVLSWLSAQKDAVTIFSPRYPWQRRHLESLDWQRTPVVLTEPIEFVSLYKGVDVVFSGGGTMTREAAFLGVPAVTTFQGAVGDVDRHLQSLGRLTVVSDQDDLERFDLRALRRRPPLRTSSEAQGVLDSVLAVVSTRARRR